ncbi:MAG: cobalamin biosynthesis protein [Oscillospiraceae bacterium]|nr:cobalamin biosynthesis protein [Oscillospiraceae bacterium]
MKLSVISFTERGMLLSKTVRNVLLDTLEDIALFTKCSRCHDETVPFVTEGLSSWAGGQMQKGNAILFIGACGIAVRAVAPHLVSKLEDSPVLVLDEGGQYVIPLVAGHIGGGNALARLLADHLRAQPVITTATDLRGAFAVDLFAKQNHLSIGEKGGIAKVSSKVLSGQAITMAMEPGHLDEKHPVPREVRLVPYPPKGMVDVLITTQTIPVQASLRLYPKIYVVGMGCKRGTSEETLRKFYLQTLKQHNIARESVMCLCSIAQKKDEMGLCGLCARERLPFVTYSAETLRRVEGDFHGSDFVKQQVGVDNVCERAAKKKAGDTGVLVVPKQRDNGMTIAVVKTEWRVQFDTE